MYLCGAIVVLMFSILTFGNATEWFDYVSSVIFLGLAVTLAYRGLRLLAKARSLLTCRSLEASFHDSELLAARFYPWTRTSRGFQDCELGFL